MTRKLLSDTSNLGSLCVCVRGCMVGAFAISLLLAVVVIVVANFSGVSHLTGTATNVYIRYCGSQSVYGNNLTIAVRVRSQNDRMKNEEKKECRQKNMQCDDDNGIGKGNFKLRLKLKLNMLYPSAAPKRETF